jgi:hypothetical protein
MFVETTIGNKTYKLRLTTKGSISLEKALGYNPLSLLLAFDEGKLPTLNDMLIVLHAMLQPFNHGTSMDDVYDIYDAFIADGKTMFDLVPLFVEVFQESGYIGKNKEGQEDQEKN